MSTVAIDAAAKAAKTGFCASAMISAEVRPCELCGPKTETTTSPTMMKPMPITSVWRSGSGSLSRPVDAIARVKTIVSPANGATTESGRKPST